MTDEPDRTDDDATEADGADGAVESDRTDDAAKADGTDEPDQTDDDATEANGADGAVEPDRTDGSNGAVEAERPGVVAVLRGIVRGRRRLALACTASVLAVAIVVVLISVTSGDEDRPVPRGAIPTLGSQFASPPSSAPSEPSEPAPLPPYSGAPLWTVALPEPVDENDPPELGVTDHGYVLQTDEQLVGLNRKGKRSWNYAAPQGLNSFTARAAGAVVFVSYTHPTDGRWPQPEIIIALDAATGKELWREEEASLWSATTDTVYLSVCYGGQNDHIGDCDLSARDPLTNATRWSIPTYASSRLINTSDGLQADATPPYLLVGSYPTGSDSFTTSSHDPETGETLGTGYAGPDGITGHIGVETDETVVATDDQDENPADGCHATLTGYALYGAAQTWKYVARTGKEDDGRRCASLPDSLNDGRLGVTSANGAPSVLNADTGAIEWTAPTKSQALAASETTLLAVSEKEDSPGGELVAYRVGHRKPLWRAPFTATPAGVTVSITDTTAVVHGPDTEAVGYDLKSGKASSYGATVNQETATWIAVCDTGSCRGFATG